MDVYQRRRLVALSAVAAIFVILVLLIRSCGGDDEDANPLTSSVPATSGALGASPLPQEDFADQGDSICLDTNTSLAALDSTDETQDATDRAELLSGELDSLQSLALAPGEKGETKLSNFLASLAKQVQGYDELATATEREDEAAITDITTTIDEAAADAQHAADNFGFKVCGDTSKVSETSGNGVTEQGGGTAVPEAPATTTPVTPTTTAPATPPADGGGTAPAPSDGGDDGGSSSGSGGLTP